MNNSFRFLQRIRLIILLTFVITAGGSMDAAGKSAKKKADTEQNLRKADYFFMEGIRQKQLGNSDAYFEFLQKAHELNPSDKFIGKEYGFNLLRLASDSASYAQGYALMEDYIRENHDDFYGNVIFATLSSRMGKHDKAIETWKRLYDDEPQTPEIIARYADALTASGKEENLMTALALYDTLERAEGIDIQLISDRIRLDMIRRDTTAVESDLLRLIDSSPSVADYHIFAGDVYSMLQMGDSAISHYDRAVELDPGNGLAYYSRARYYQTVGDSVAFNREVFQALEQENLDVEPKIEILRGYTAQFYADSLQQPRISAMFRRLIELHPHEVDIHTLYRDYLYAINDLEGAAEQASYALDIDPSDEKQWIALTSLYLQTNKMDESYNAAQRGLHFFPQSYTLYFLGGTALSQLKEYDKAMEFLNKALELTEESNHEMLSDIYTSIGDIYYHNSNTDDAFANYRKAIELNPENTTAMNNCAYYMACEDIELDKALELIEKVIEVRPDDPTSLDTYAWVLFKRRDYSGARQMIDKAIENSDTPSGELYEHAGDIYFMLREPAEALDFWKKALELDPDSELLQKKVKHKTYFYE